MTAREIMYVMTCDVQGTPSFSVGYYRVRNERDCYDWLMTYLYMHRYKLRPKFQGVDAIISSMRIIR